MSLKNTSKSFFQLFSSGVIVFICNFFIFSLFLNYYVPEEYGKVALFEVIYGILTIFLFFTERAKVRFGREEFDNTKKYNKTYWSIVIIKIPIVTITSILILIYSNSIKDYIGISNEIIFVLVSFSIISLFSGNIKFLNVEEKFNIISLLKFIKVATGVLGIFLLSFNIIKPIAIFLIIIAISNFIIQEIITLFFIYKKIGFFSTNWKWTKLILLFSLPFIFHFLSARTCDYIDTIVINKYLTIQDVGVYAVAYKFRAFSIIPLAIISTIISPKLISLYIKNKSDKIKWFYFKIVAQISFFITQIAAIVVLLLPLLIILIGHKYVDVISPLAILLITFAWTPIVYIMLPFFYASKKIYPHILSNIILAVTNVLLAFILIPLIGIMGGAISTILSEGLSFIIHGIYFKKYFEVNNLKHIKFGFPLIITAISVAIGLNWILIFILFLTSSLITWSFAFKKQIFDEESLNFYKKIGLPKIIEQYFIKIYSKYLVTRVRI